jgi:hypothetical protein
MRPRFCKAVTTRSLWAGETRAKTSIASTSRSNASSLIASSSAPVTTRPPFRIPSSRAIAAAVSGWSPVIITTRTPAPSHVRTAGAASGRGGSIMATRPRNVCSCSAVSSVAPAFEDTPSTRIASPAIPRAAATTRARAASSSGTSPAAAASRVHVASTTSGAPFDTAFTPSFVRCKVVMRFDSEVNGISATRGCSASSAGFERPAFAAATTSAPSVGSPFTCQRFA